MYRSRRHSGPQGKVVPHTIVDDPSDWTAESLAGKESEYTYKLTDADVKEIIAATDKIKARIPATEEAVRKVATRAAIASKIVGVQHKAGHSSYVRWGEGWDP